MESDGPTKTGGGGATKKEMVSINLLSHIPVSAEESALKAKTRVQGPGIRESLVWSLNASYAEVSGELPTT